MTTGLMTLIFNGNISPVDPSVVPGPFKWGKNSKKTFFSRILSKNFNHSITAKYDNHRIINIVIIPRIVYYFF